MGIVSVNFKWTRSSGLLWHRIEIDIASRTPKQEEDEPDYPTSEPLRRKRQEDVEEMNLTINTDVAQDDGKEMKFTNCERTAASDDSIANDNHLTYRLTDVDEPIQLTQFIRKVSLSRPVMSQVSPAEGIDLIESQKTNWVIQKMIRVLEGSEILQHPVNMQDQFFQKLHKNRKRLQVVNGVLPKRLNRSHETILPDITFAKHPCLERWITSLSCLITSSK